MSLFDFPRINVFGTQIVNPGTGNNDSASPGTELAVVSNSERVRAMTQGMSDADFRKFMQSPDQYGFLRSQWNYYGDFSFRFIDVRVQSTMLDYGQPVTDPKVDALIGGRVNLTNALCIDSNPEGYHTTQMFVEALQINAPAAFGSQGVFSSRRPTRATTRWLNWYRNVSYHGLFGLPNPPNLPITSGGAGGASAAFQCGMEILPEDLEPAPHSSAGENQYLYKFLATDQSPAAQAIASLIKSGKAQGIVFHYSLYLCYPQISDTELAQIFASGDPRQNPSIGLVCGTIAPWLKGEISTNNMGRYLKPANSFFNPYRTSKPYYLSPAIARYDEKNKYVSVDLANCLPEDGGEGVKYNMGEVSLGIRAACTPDQDPTTNKNPVTTLGVIPNTREIYNATGGVADVSLSAVPAATIKQLSDDGYELVLQTALNGVLLYEPQYFCTSDCECNYLDELPPGKNWTDPDIRKELAAQPWPALRGEVELLVMNRGRWPKGDVAIKIEQWQETPTGYANPGQYGDYRYPTLLKTDIVTAKKGRVVYPLAPMNGPGLRVFRIVPQNNWPQNIQADVFSNQQAMEYYVDCRVLPFDDYSQVTDEQLTFDVIYKEIFQYYHLILPAMSLRLDMSDPNVFDTPTAAHYVLRMIKRSLWGTYNYMPRTRDLSKYRRELLRRFCHKVLCKHGIVVNQADD